MPIYEFACGSCGHEFEQILSFSASAPPCPVCHGSQVMRRVGRPAIHFKGSGWYITDSKQGNGKNGHDKQGEKEKSGEKSIEAESASANGASAGGETKSKAQSESSKSSPPSASDS